MPFFLYTFRPQINEQKLFEQFLDVFLPFLKEFPSYSYSVEEEGTLQQHIHIMYEHHATDNSKAMPQKLNKKCFSLFKSALKNKMTNDKGFDDRKVNDNQEDFLKVLGYVNKETNCLRRKSVGFTNEEILKAVGHYYACEHLDKSIVKNDLNIMTSKNIHISIKDYCVKNNLEPTQPLTKLKMIKDGYMFSQVTKVAETFDEIEINMFPDRFDELDDKSYDNMSYRINQQQEELQKLRSQLYALKHHFKIAQIENTFDGRVRIRGLGSDEDFKYI